jgi:hypothetical protein
VGANALNERIHGIYWRFGRHGHGLLFLAGAVVPIVASFIFPSPKPHATPINQQKATQQAAARSRCRNHNHQHQIKSTPAASNLYLSQ